jgi:hypothetical protein
MNRTMSPSIGAALRGVAGTVRWLLLLVLVLAGGEVLAWEGFILQVDSPEVDLVWPLADPLTPGDRGGGRIDLGNPENIQDEVVYDPLTGQYVVPLTIDHR